MRSFETVLRILQIVQIARSHATYVHNWQHGGIVVENDNMKLSYRRDSARCETAIQGHPRSSVFVPIDAAYMTITTQ